MFREAGGLKVWAFESLERLGAGAVAITRRGGVSPAPWGSLNLGSTVGDDYEHVRENRRRVFAALGRAEASLYDVWQVHGRRVVRVDAPWPQAAAQVQADAMITDQSDVTLLMRFADCTPVLLVDPVHRALGLVHAGWQGTVKGVVTAALEAMEVNYGTRPAEVVAAIGPSIGAHHYPVGEEVAAAARAAFGAQAAAGLLPRSPAGAMQFDLWAANRRWLEEAGVQQVEVSGLCTACHGQDWYSHRAEAGRTGRFGVALYWK